MYPHWIILGGERNAGNTRVQPGTAFLSRHVGQISHTFACTARRTAARVREREACTRETFLSIGGRPARLGSASRGAGRTTLSSRVDIDTAPSPSTSPSELRCSRCADKALIAAPRYAEPLGSRKDCRAPWIKTATRRCRAPSTRTTCATGRDDVRSRGALSFRIVRLTNDKSFDPFAVGDSLFVAYE